MNIDLDEIKKFDQFSTSWWDTHGEMKMLHTLNPLRLSYIQKKTALDKKKVIDIGCGGGILTESLAKKGAIVTGIDMSEAALQIAKTHTEMPIDYIHTTAEKIAAEQPGHYDIVTCFEMLEHVPDPLSIVEACATLVKPDGHIFFSTINRNVKSYCYAILGAEYILKLLPKGTHDFAKFIRPSELSEWARKAALTVTDITGIDYSLATKQFSLSEDVSVNYFAYATINVIVGRV